MRLSITINALGRRQAERDEPEVCMYIDCIQIIRQSIVVTSIVRENESLLSI